MPSPEIDYLFIAIPNLAFKPKVLDLMLEKGLVTRSQYDDIKANIRIYRKSHKVVDAGLGDKAIIDRLLAVAGEILTIEMVDILRTAGAITPATGHALRLALRSVRVIRKPKKSTIARRMFGLLGVGASQEMIDLWLTLNLISSEEANYYRSILRVGKNTTESLVAALRSKSILDALILLGDIPMNEDSIRGLVRAGIMSPKMGNSYIAALRAGVQQWRVFKGANLAEGYRARLLLVATGSLNSDMLLFLKRIGVITKQQRVYLEIAALASNQINQKIVEDLTKRRFRIYPGEAPITTFAKASRTNEGDLLRLLADAARESRKEAKILAAKGSLRADQYNLQARALHEAMRKMWEGVGYLTIWRESEVAEAAVESSLAMQNKVLKGLPDDLRRSLQWTAKAGIDSYISREENTLKLSRSVYKNIDLWNGNVDQRIKLGLLRGQSAEEIARSVQRMIDPRVAGGVQYAARRLARTELNNAFHLTTIRFSRENPWVRGYKWNRSNSHGRLDQCDAYANQDNGMGAGVFKKTNVPDKPHPNCLCYLTTVLMSEDEFIAASRAGRFDRWRKSVVDNEVTDTYGKDVLARAVSGYVGAYALEVGAGAAVRAFR